MEVCTPVVEGRVNSCFIGKRLEETPKFLPCFVKHEIFHFSSSIQILAQMWPNMRGTPPPGEPNVPIYSLLLPYLTWVQNRGP